MAALKAGDTEKAKDLFGPTRIHYEAVEPIAESFGNLDPEIDARVNDVEDRSKWTGFHKIEQILWRKDTTKGTDALAAKLLADVEDARRQGRRARPAGRADRQRRRRRCSTRSPASKITGEEDRYSHTDMSDFQGNFTGAKEAFEALKPALEERGDGQPRDEHRRPDRRASSRASTATSATRRWATPSTPSSRRRTAGSSPSRSRRWPSRCRSSPGRC